MSRMTMTRMVRKCYERDRDGKLVSILEQELTAGEAFIVRMAMDVRAKVMESPVVLPSGTRVTVGPIPSWVDLDQLQETVVKVLQEQCPDRIIPPIELVLESEAASAAPRDGLVEFRGNSK